MFFSFFIVEDEIIYFASPMLVFYSIYNKMILPSWKSSLLMQC